MSNSLVVFNPITNDGYGHLSENNEITIPPFFPGDPSSLPILKYRFLFGISYDLKNKFIIETIQPVLRMRLTQSKFPPGGVIPGTIHVEFNGQWWSISLPQNEIPRHFPILKNEITREEISLKKAARWWRAALESNFDPSSINIPVN